MGRDIWPLAGVVEGSDSAPFAGVEVDADGGEGVKPWVDAELGLTSVTVITLPLGDRFNDLGVGTSRSNSSLGIFGVLLTFPPRPVVSFRSFISRASVSAFAPPPEAGFGVVVRGGNISLAWFRFSRLVGLRGEAETGRGGAVPGMERMGSLVALAPDVTGPAAPAFGPCCPWPACPCPNWDIPNGLDGLFSFSEFFLLRFLSGGEGLFAVDVVGVEAD